MAKSAGRVKGSASLRLQLDSVAVSGIVYNIQTLEFEEEGRGRGKRTAVSTGVGVAAGVILGTAVTGKKGAAIGLAARAGLLTLGAALTGDREVKIPPETKINFLMSKAITIYLPGDY
jgi:hypothetical protein